MRRTRGMTLIELMIVVTIVAAIAAVAIPSLLRSRASANETSAIASLKTFHTANEQFKMDNGTYATSKNDLANGSPPYYEIVHDLAGQRWRKSGYDFWYRAGGAGEDYLLNADPTMYGESGVRSFIINESGVIHFRSDGENAVLSDPVVE